MGQWKKVLALKTEAFGTVPVECFPKTYCTTLFVQDQSSLDNPSEGVWCWLCRIFTLWDFRYRNTRPVNVTWYEYSYTAGYTAILPRLDIYEYYTCVYLLVCSSEYFVFTGCSYEYSYDTQHYSCCELSSGTKTNNAEEELLHRREVQQYCCTCTLYLMPCCCTLTAVLAAVTTRMHASVASRHEPWKHAANLWTQTKQPQQRKQSLRDQSVPPNSKCCCL